MRLAYLDYGNEGAPPAVLVHATGFHKELWGPLARALAPRYRVLAFDQRGQGDSDKSSDDYHWPRFADDLAGFLDAFKLRDVLAIGHSAGGTAVTLATATRPDLFGCVVLVEPALLLPGPLGKAKEGDHGLAERTRKRQESFASVEAVFDYFRNRPPFKSWTDEALWTYARHGTAPGPDGRVHLKCPPDLEAQIVESQLYETSGVADPLQALGLLRCPTLLIQAAGRPGPADRMRQALPSAQYVEVPGGGHFLPMEQPAAVTTAIDHFLARHYPAVR